MEHGGPAHVRRKAGRAGPFFIVDLVSSRGRRLAELVGAGTTAAGPVSKIRVDSSRLIVRASS